MRSSKYFVLLELLSWYENTILLHYKLSGKDESEPGWVNSAPDGKEATQAHPEIKDEKILKIKIRFREYFYWNRTK